MENFDDPTDRLGPKVNVISNSFRRIADESTHELGITGVQSFLLGYLLCHRDAPPCQRDIEERFNIKHPTATGLLARLCEKGCVEFASDEYDGRRKRIVITDAGASAAERTRARLDDMEKRLTANFTSEELFTLHALLDRLVENVKSDGARRQEGDLIP